MSDSQPSRVFMSENNDPEMERASESARASFRYFWRELAWERRRIIPALTLAAVKAPCADGTSSTPGQDRPNAEHMWLSEVGFDSQAVSGVLLNQPNWLTSVKKGEAVRVPLAEISDWMYAVGREVFGAYTVNLLRSRMGPQERAQHDSLWGLNFGDPTHIRVVPEPNKGGGLLKNWFGKKPADPEEHPMSVNMAASLQEQLAKNPSLVSAKDEEGWTLLHQEALAGSAPTVQVLLAAGADRDAVTNHGMTAWQLARSLGWTRVLTLLEQK